MNEADFKKRLTQDARQLRASLPESRHARMVAEIERTEMNAGLNVSPDDLRTVKLRRGSPWVHVAAVAAGCVLLAVVIFARFQPVMEPEKPAPESVAVQHVPENAADESLIRPATVVSFMSYPVRLQPAPAPEPEADDADPDEVPLAKLLPCQQTLAVLVDIFRPTDVEY